MSPHSRAARFVRLVTIGCLFASTGALIATRQAPLAEAIDRGAITATHFDTSAPLTELALAAPVPDIEQTRSPDPPDAPAAAQASSTDPSDRKAAGQSEIGETEIASLGAGFDTLTNISGVTPPGPSGDVGPNHYVVMSHHSYAVYSKTGALLAGPAYTNSIWSGFGGACQTENGLDPIVVHDQFADRWLLTQRTSAGPEYFLCVALSTGPSPTGTYYRWAFSTGTHQPRSPKFGVWPTEYESAYFASTWEFAGGPFGSFVGVGAYAFNRSQMLAGVATPVVLSHLATPGSAPYGVGEGLLPADTDGITRPMISSPGFFLGSQDNGGPYGAPADAVNLWKFTINPGFLSSSFVWTHTLPVAATDTRFSCEAVVFPQVVGGPRQESPQCIAQPGTTRRLDHQGYRQRLLHRAAYRNYGTHESIVLNQSVEATTNFSGIRWYELRSPNASPVIYQQGTYAPDDGVQRWAGSVAMDAKGNMALGYSVSNGTSVYPGIRYTGRRASDPLGTLPAGEGVIVNGGGAQTGSSGWGDYSSMNVDPIDDCTFWYTSEYVPATSATGWRLRVGSFKFPDCPASPATFHQVHNSTPLAIPVGVSTINSTINLSGLTGVIGQVRVSLHLTHTWDADVQARLIGPDGTTVELTTNNGNSDDNYGTSCAPESRTTFADDVGPSIMAGSAPFVGTFRPEQALSAFSGKTGSALNGTWTLRISDTFPSADGGVLQCWSLFVEPAFHNTTPIPIPDLSVIESPITVAGVTGSISDVRVSLHLTHTYDADLRLFLIGPDGTARRLANNRGGNGDNFGTGCAPASARTSFHDAATEPISAGVAPFPGSYRPEESLAAFKGRGGTGVNGTWRLRIEDTAGADVGTLHCWSLSIVTSPSPLDFDLDGDPDLLWQHPDGRAVLWRMNGTSYTGDATYLYASPLDWHLRGSADFTGDGKPDLIWQHPSGRAVIWVMNGTTYTGDARPLYSGSTEWRLIGAGDFTFDGKPDLIWQDPTGRAVIWVMDGTNYTGDARALYSGSTEWRLIGAGDFTADGKPDLIWQHPTGSAVIWVMDGTTYAGDARYLYSGSTEWTLKGSADYTLDGKLDLLWQHPSGMATIWVMNGTTYSGDARYLYSSPTEWKVAPR